MNRNCLVLRVAKRRPLRTESVITEKQFSPLESLEFTRQREYIGKVEPNPTTALEVILLDLWVCRECGDQFPECDGVEEFLDIHAKKHAYGLIRKVR